MYAPVFDVGLTGMTFESVSGVFRVFKRICGVTTRKRKRNVD